MGRRPEPGKSFGENIYMQMKRKIAGIINGKEEKKTGKISEDVSHMYKSKHEILQDNWKEVGQGSV